MKAAAQATEYGTAAAETEAQVRVDKAGQVLARHQGLHATALEPLTPKETALTQSANFGEDLQVKLEQAQAKLKNPVRIGYGGKTLIAGLVRLVTADQVRSYSRFDQARLVGSKWTSNDARSRADAPSGGHLPGGLTEVLPTTAVRPGTGACLVFPG